MTNITKAARDALETLETTLRHFSRSPSTLADSTARVNAHAALATLRVALAEQDKQAGDEREAFEAWMRADSTIPLDRDAHGYADFTTGLLWHAWQAATKANAPVGASVGEPAANGRLGLAGADSICRHDFVLQPSSSINLCAKCGVSETAARAMLAARPAAPATVAVALTDERARWFSLVMGAAASLEDAANCLRDPDAERLARSAAEHYRKAANAMPTDTEGKEGGA